MKQKTVVITGASSGIGMEFARAFSKMGCRLILTARRKERLEKLREELGTPCKIIVADLSREGECYQFFENIADEPVDATRISGCTPSWSQASNLPVRCNSRLYLIGNKQDIFGFTQFIGFFQISFIRHKNTGFPLNRFQQKTGHIRILKCFLQSRNIIIRNLDESGSERSVSGIRFGIVRERNDRNGTSMKISRHKR